MDNSRWILPENPEENAPELQTGKAIQEQKFSAFGLSVQGFSHMKKNVPCQDSNDFRCLPDVGLMVAAIADGVGSCPLSQWGSHLAVQTALDYLEVQLRQAARGKTLKQMDDQWIYEQLVESFRCARNAVEAMATESELRVADFQSTLTVVIYDGAILWCCHAGDDGVVAQFRDGFVKMVTQRQKGEEASSVFPLQSGEAHWQVSKVASPSHGNVVGLVLATDGVLDAFVMDHPKYLEALECCNGVFYPFIRDAFYDDDPKRPGPCDPRRRLADYTALMNGDSYRMRVTDDLTFVAVLSPEGIAHGAIPVFDPAIWRQTADRIQQERMTGLYTPQQPAPPKPTIPKNTDLEIPERPNVKNPEPERTVPEDVFGPERRQERGSRSSGTAKPSDFRQPSEPEPKQNEEMTRKMVGRGLAAAGALVGIILIGAISISMFRNRESAPPEEEPGAFVESEPTEMSEGALDFDPLSRILGPKDPSEETQEPTKETQGSIEGTQETADESTAEGTVEV